MSNPPDTLVHRHVPDVPEDVDDIYEHLNDPNWDYSPASPTLSANSFDLEKKGRAYTESSRHSTSDFDTESHVGSHIESSYGKATGSTTYGGTTIPSKSQLWRTGTHDFDEYVASFDRLWQATNS